MSKDVLRTQASPPNVPRPLWTVVRGEEVVDCVLVASAAGHVTLRCGYGPHSVIRSQCVASATAAAAVSEAWKTALTDQGFRLVSRTDATNPFLAFGRELEHGQDMAGDLSRHAHGTSVTPAS